MLVAAATKDKAKAAAVVAHARSCAENFRRRRHSATCSSSRRRKKRTKRKQWWRVDRRLQPRIRVNDDNQARQVDGSLVPASFNPVMRATRTARPCTLESCTYEAVLFPWPSSTVSPSVPELPKALAQHRCLDTPQRRSLLGRRMFSLFFFP